MIILTGFAVAGLLGAPWVPAKRKDLERMLGDAKLEKDHVFIELGCGDGRLLKVASKRGAKAIGYEINPIMWFIAWARNARDKNVSVQLGNFWHKDLGSADVVMTFLMPKFMRKLEDKLQNELSRGAVFISYIFNLPTKKPAIKKKRWLVYIF